MTEPEEKGVIRSESDPRFVTILPTFRTITQDEYTTVRVLPPPPPKLPRRVRIRHRVLSQDETTTLRVLPKEAGR